MGAKQRPGSGGDGRLRALYLCYLSLDDPLVHTQVVAYLSGLARAGHTIHLLTWEPRRLTPPARRRRRRELAQLGISWHGLHYHKRLSLLATAWDAARGAVLAVWLLRRHRLQAVHARSHVPAFIALLVRRTTGCRLIFDIRGLMAEEYADTGRWQPDGVAYRLIKKVERAAVTGADGIVVLTHKLRQLMFSPEDERVFVIPCCADTARIAAGERLRDQVRSELGVADRTVLVYVGKFESWYMENELAAFFAVARTLADVHCLVVSQSDPQVIDSRMRAAGVAEDAVTITRAPPDRMPGLLAAADGAVSFVRPLPSKISSSPTKVGEYLSAGLPVLSSAAIGDVDELLTRTGCGVVIERFDDEALRLAARDLITLTGRPGVAERCRAAAAEELDLETVGIARYDALYRLVTKGNIPGAV